MSYFLDYEEYLSHYLSDEKARSLLNNELDWDNDCNRDLYTIADSMENWEVCSSHLNLTPIEIDDLKAKHSGESPRLLR